MPHRHRTTAVSRRTVTKAASVAGLAALLGTAAGTARAATQLGPRTFDVSVESAALGRSAPVRLILPSDFDAQPGRTYPVLYLLHGAHDDYTSWTRETDIEAFTAGRDLIVAMPDGGPTGIPTAWLSGPDYETLQLTEVPAMLKRDYVEVLVAVGDHRVQVGRDAARQRPVTREHGQRRVGGEPVGARPAASPAGRWPVRPVWWGSTAR